MKKLTKTYMATTMIEADFYPAIYAFGGHYIFKYLKNNSKEFYNKAKERALNYMRFHTGGTDRVEKMWENFCKTH